MRRSACSVAVGLALTFSFACSGDDKDSIYQGSEGDGDGDGDGDGTGDGDGDGDGGGDGDGDGDGDGGPNLDVAGPTGGGACGCEFNYVWVANSSQGTVSKVNMDTIEEEARYLTREDGNGNPSRTSVSLSADVAVANRHAGLVKFYADVADCEDSNGTPGIQTSQGADDVLPWEEEECRAWFVDFPTTNQRPVAWTPGDVTPGTCDTTNEKLWTVTSTNPGLFPGLGAPGSVTVHRLDGDTGTIEDQVEVPTFSGDQFGAYGGAVDLEGNLFFTSLGGLSPSKLARVDIDNLAYAVWDMPQGVGSYGITVDHLGQVWISSNSIGQIAAARFDPETETWDTVTGFWGGSGLAEGPNGQMWVSSGSGVHAVDIVTLAQGDVFYWDQLVKGVGFDNEGYMWGVTWADEDENGNPIEDEYLLKVDPATVSVVGSYDGLDRPYTYSDFTGNALANVACPPAG